MKEKKFPKKVYLLKRLDIPIYIGITTLNLKRRMFCSYNSKEIIEYRNNNELTIELLDIIENKDQMYKETYYIKKFINDGYNLLNKRLGDGPKPDYNYCKCGEIKNRYVHFCYKCTEIKKEKTKELQKIKNKILYEENKESILFDAKMKYAFDSEFKEKIKKYNRDKYQKIE